MNEQIIKNSNKYQYYQKQRKMLTYIFLGFTALFMFFIIPGMFFEENLLIIGVAMTVMVGLILILPIIYYIYKAKQIIKTANDYRRYKGVVVNLKTRYYRGGVDRTATIVTSSIKKELKSKIFQGELFEYIYMNSSVEFLYNANTNDVVIYKVLDEKLEMF